MVLVSFAGSGYANDSEPLIASQGLEGFVHQLMPKK